MATKKSTPKVSVIDRIKRSQEYKDLMQIVNTYHLFANRLEQIRAGGARVVRYLKWSDSKTKTGDVHIKDGDIYVQFGDTDALNGQSYGVKMLSNLSDYADS